MTDEIKPVSPVLSVVPQHDGVKSYYYWNSDNFHEMN